MSKTKEYLQDLGLLSRNGNISYFSNKQSLNLGSVKIIVDSSKINALFDELNLDNKDRKKAIKAALRKSASIIRKQAQNNLVSAVPGARTEGIGKNGIRYKPLKNEINIAVYRNASGARIDLLDRRKPNSRAYLLKFFNSGTDIRTTKRRRNRGEINATNFFTNTVSSKRDEAANILEQNIIDMINKIASKRK